MYKIVDTVVIGGVGEGKVGGCQRWDQVFRVA